MPNTNTTTSSGGIGFFGLLGVLFIGLKLAGFINWSWWLVLMPIYAPIVVVLAIIIFVVAIMK